MPSLQRYTVKGRDYFRIVESKRINGKPTPQPIMYIGSRERLIELLLSKQQQASPAPSNRSDQYAHLSDPVESNESHTATISECLTVGNIFRTIPYDIVDQALRSTDRSKRRLGSFPDHFVIYYVVLMCLFMNLAYAHAMQKLRDALEAMSNGLYNLEKVSDEAIAQARNRVTHRPLEVLFNLVCRPIAGTGTPGAFFKNLLLVVIDGAVFDVEDTVANEIGFGRPKNQAGDGAYPQVRCVALIEQASRAVIDLLFGPITTTSEQSLGQQLLARIKPGMLCLADRLYPTYENCKTVIDAKAYFLWRIKKDVRLEPIEFLLDKSYIARLYAYSESRHRIKEKFIEVRVIEYELKGSSEKYRLITNILDHSQAPAEQLAKLYPYRWTEETFYEEIKTTLRKPRIVLRSKSPALVIQELYGLFLAHFSIRVFMLDAANKAGIPPDVLSFSHSKFVVTDHLQQIGDFSP
jgi:hypothetical protein